MVRKVHEHETEDCWIVERQADNHQFVAFRWNAGKQHPQLWPLIERGCGHSWAAVLHHPNLVSYINDYWAHHFTGSGSEREWYSVFDYCDAGTLRNFLDHTEVLPKTQQGTGAVLQWLPESLVWHVATSLLSALAWMHKGERQTETVVWGEDGSATRTVGEDTALTRDEDWFPLLHRDIRAENVFFQHPKGIETYGYCKLGGFGRVFVSGSTQLPLTCEGEGRNEVELKQTVAKARAETMLAGRNDENYDKEPKVSPDKAHAVHVPSMRLTNS